MMAPFPVPADHWHFSTPRRVPEESQRMTKEQALAMLRKWLEADFQATKDPRVPAALADLDKGWTSARFGGHQYVAFACACPPPTRERRDVP